ncbi:tRNA dihydrouridine synthase [Oceanivirga miroungae]|nr:tRNA-dihydrouridine synthase family protein [Oceanivirga miroungae]
MSGYTDFSYRQIMKKFGPDLMYTEMVNSNLLSQKNSNTLEKIMRISNDENTGIQLFGSDIENLYNNFIYLNELGYHDLLLNMGCPQPKILKNGSGANMLERYDEIQYLLSSLKEKNISVSIKIRDSINTMKYFNLANKLNIPYLCLHPRTKEQGFNGFANHNITKKLSSLDRNFKLIANGDIFSLEDYRKISKYNIDGVMLARGIISNPYLIKEIKEDKKIIRSLEEDKNLIIEHINLLVEDKGEKKALLEINKFLIEYFKFLNKEDMKSILVEKDYNRKIKLIKEVKLP